MKTKGLLVVISGFSGAGKGTLIRELRNRHDNYRLSVSATTRQPRTEDIPGVTYFFLTREEFEKMIADGGFLEYAEYNKNYYGTPRSYVEQELEKGHDVLLEIEVQGGVQVMSRRPDAITIFIAAPSFEELARRLRGRGDTDEEKVQMRLQQARMEYLVAPQYQFIVVNDDLEDAVDDVQSILRTEELRSEKQQHLLKEAL